MTTSKRSSGDAASELEARVRASANRIWLAGLGAFALAEQEGGKLFKSLVRKGETLEAVGKERFEQVRDGVGAVAGAAKERVESASGEMRERAGEAWTKVERELDDRVASALEKVGVPSKGEIARLTRRIEQLTELVEQQAKSGGAGGKAAGKPGKTAAKTGGRAATRSRTKPPGARKTR
jgi:poly(hydroxyalkanoate) granule-associated protein